VLVNLVPLCGSGTTGCHGRIEARDKEARDALRRKLQATHISYLEYRLGETRWKGWLDRNYPWLAVAA
jgi:hypothetical protein